MKMIKFKFVVHPEEDQQCASNPKGQAENVYCGEKLVPKDIPDGDKKIVFEHGGRGLIQGQGVPGLGCFTYLENRGRLLTKETFNESPVRLTYI
jgi:hypothetical protein